MNSGGLQSPVTESAISRAPDWSVISHEFHCPLCEYNLRGLIEPRCPECGYRFEWAAILDPSSQIHPYLFEHHPNESVRSWWLTLRGGLLPRRFWTQLKPVHAVNARRIINYWLLTVMAALVCLAAAILVLLAARKLADIRHLHLSGTRRYQPLPFKMRFRSTSAWWHTFILPFALAIATLQVILPWLTFASLTIFQASIRRKGTNIVHLLRCVLYSTDALLWANFVALLGSIAAFAYWLIIQEADPNQIFGRYAPYRMTLYFFQPAWGIVCCRLYLACRKYLQLEHALAAMIASQTIVALAVPAAIVIVVAIKEWL